MTGSPLKSRGKKKDPSQVKLQHVPAHLPQASASKKLAAIVPKETANAHDLPVPAAAELENRQLSLFQTFLSNNDEQRDQLSNAIDLWDSMPRYSVSRQAMTKSRIVGRFLEKHETVFQHRGRTFTRIISPARIADEDGEDRDFYPSASEELVEDALRKIAVEQQSGYFDKVNYRSGVVFTLYTLREEMRKRGHSRSFQEIVQSLNILSHSIIDIVPHGDGEARITSAYFTSLAAVSRSKLKDDPEAKWSVQFHPLVTAAIDQVTHRQYNYHLNMSHSSQLARWLHKQLILKFTFADHFKPFEMRFSTIKRDSGLLDGYGRDRAAIDMVEEAFTELQQHDVLSSYTRKDETGLRRKILDVVFTLRPSPGFIRETKAANKRQQIVREQSAAR